MPPVKYFVMMSSCADLTLTQSIQMIDTGRALGNGPLIEDYGLWQRESRRVKISESQSIVYKSSSFIGHDKSLFFCVLLAVGGVVKYLVEAHRAR